MEDVPAGVHDAVTPYYATVDQPRLVKPSTLEEATSLYGHSAAIVALRERVARFAKSSATVLVLGETGTGKELVARSLHLLSPRAKGPFIAANVATFSESMLESTLFGHERGAFTGAHVRHRGLFEQADRGTLFLDEVGELAPAAQAALLRVLETGEVRPVGTERSRHVNVRLVVATHRDLARLAETAAFRPDLYYRLSTLLLRLPPLRERLGDLPELTRHLLERCAPELGRRVLDPSAIQLLTAQRWPGNIRQLQNVLRRAAIETDAKVLSAAHIRAALGQETSCPAPIRTVNGTDIAAAFDAEGGNLTRTARRLGIARSTLRGRLKRAGPGISTD